MAYGVLEYWSDGVMEEPSVLYPPVIDHDHKFRVKFDAHVKSPFHMDLGIKVFRNSGI